MSDHLTVPASAQNSKSPQKAPKARVSVKFIIVGGSITGLATAYALRQAGHEVVVAERSDGKKRSTGGLRSPPNMTKILSEWGFMETLSKISTKCKAYKFRNGCDGGYIGNMNMSESIRDYVLSDLLFLKYDDLYSLLLDRTTELGVKILFDAEVVGIDRENMVVTLKGGETLRADVIVGADGHESTTRGLTIPETEFVADDEHSLFLTFEVAAAALHSDDDFAALKDPAEWLVWVGDDFLVHANILPGGEYYTISITKRHRETPKEGDETWQDRSFSEFNVDPSAFEPRVQKLLSLAKNTAGKVYRFFPPIESMVCDDSRVVLVGEAGHPILPNGHYNTGLCFEDAQTLGLLFSRIQAKHQIPQLLNAFEEIRQPRSAFAGRFATTQRSNTLLPRGPVMEYRDAMMRKVLAYDRWEEMDAESFSLVWEQELLLVGHDASETMEDWWNQWGGYFEEKGSTTRRASIVEVTILRGQSDQTLEQN